MFFEGLKKYFFIVFIGFFRFQKLFLTFSLKRQKKKKWVIGPLS